jgi:hypothetical protein
MKMRMVLLGWLLSFTPVFAAPAVVKVGLPLHTPGPAQPRYEVVEVAPVPFYSYGLALNDTGQVGGGLPVDDEGTYLGFIWQRGQLTLLPTGPVSDINSAGTHVPGGFYPAVMGPFVNLIAVNNAGQAFGLYGNAPVLATSNGWTELATFGTRSFPSALNNFGVGVGSVEVAPQLEHATVFTTSNAFDIHPEGASWSRGAGINDRGHIALSALFRDTRGLGVRAYLLRGVGTNDLGALPGLRHTFVRSMNNADQVVGMSYNSDTNGYNLSGFTGFLYSGGRLYNLDRLLVGGPWHILEACDINENGWIVAKAAYAGTYKGAVLLRRGHSVSRGERPSLMRR